MYDEEFVSNGNTRSKQEHGDFAGPHVAGSGKNQDQVFKFSKTVIDQAENDMIRAPIHGSGAPKQKATGRGNSPATGAIAGGSNRPPPAVDQRVGSAESKLPQSSTQSNLLEDSFQKLYSKELDLDEDEVPLILHELNDSAIHFISKDQWDRALSLLQKAQTLMDRLMFQLNTCDRFLVQCTMHNMALCFQKMGAIEECSLCLDACISQVNQPNMLKLYNQSPAMKLKKLKYECKMHMQVCALLSQLNRHQEALCHAKQAVQISQYMMLDLLELCEVYNQRVVDAKAREQKAQEMIQGEHVAASQFKDMFLSLADMPASEIQEKLSKTDLIYFDEKVSMLERTAHKYYPIVQEAVRRMVRHKDLDYNLASKGKPSKWIEDKVKELRSRGNEKKLASEINMKVLLGYLNQSEWMYLLNIGNIMQITPLTIHDMLSSPGIEIELARDSVIEKLSFLAVSYFCVSTELRFLVNLKDNPNVDPVQIKSESEYWHGKALELSCTFLPSESPLVSHILSSYNKHHAPVKHVIKEDDPESDENMNLRVIRPLNGIDQCKQQPLVRANKHMHIALSPLQLSPNDYVQRQKERRWMNFEKKQAHNTDFFSASNQQQSLTTENEKSNGAQNQQAVSKQATPVQKASQVQKETQTVQHQEAEPQVQVENPRQPNTDASTRKKSNSKERKAPKQQQHEPSVPLSQADLASAKQLLEQQPPQSLDEKQLQQIELVKQLIDITDLSLIYKTDEDALQAAENEGKPLQSETANSKHKVSKDQLHSIETKHLDVKKMQNLQQQLQYLKDTKIEPQMLTNKNDNSKQSKGEQASNNQSTNLIQQYNLPTRARPKTSENHHASHRHAKQHADKGTGVNPAPVEILNQVSHRQAGQKAGKRELSPNDGKFKSSLNTQYETLEPTELGNKHPSELVSHKQKSDKHLVHNINAEKNLQQLQQLSRPFTQQHFYEMQRLHNQGQNPQQQNTGGRQPASTQLSCSVTSGLTSQHSHQQQKVAPNEGPQYTTQVAGTNSRPPAGSQAHDSHHKSTDRLLMQKQQPPKLNKDLKLQLDTQLHSHRGDVNAQMHNQKLTCEQYNTAAAHITPKNKPSTNMNGQLIVLKRDGSEAMHSQPQMSRYKQNNNQILNSAQSTADHRQAAQPVVSQHRGSLQPSMKHHESVLIPGPKMQQNVNAFISKTNGAGAMVDNAHLNQHHAGSLKNQQKVDMLYSHRQSEQHISSIQPILKQAKSTSGGKDRKKKHDDSRQPAKTTERDLEVYYMTQSRDAQKAGASNQSQLQAASNAAHYQSQQHFDSKKHSIQDLGHQQHQLGTYTVTSHRNSPHKDKRALEIQTKPSTKPMKSARTSVQTPTQGHGYIKKQSTVNQMILVAQGRSSSGDSVHNKRHKQIDDSGSKSGKKVTVHPKPVNSVRNSATQSKNHSTERSQQDAQMRATNATVAPISRGNSSRNKQNQNLNAQTSSLSGPRGSVPAQYGKGTAPTAHDLNNLRQTQKSQQQKSRNNGITGVSKTVGNGASQGSAASALVSHRASNPVQRTQANFQDDMTTMYSIQMQIQQKLDNLQSKSKTKMKIKMNKSQEKVNDASFATATQGVAQRSSKLQLNMKAVQGSGHASHQNISSRPGALHSVRNVSDKQKIKLNPNNSQKFLIDQTNPSLNMNNFKQFNNYSLNPSLEGTQIDINPGLSFPGTPNMQSARGSVNNAQPALASARSYQSFNQGGQSSHAQSQQPLASQQKGIQVKKVNPSELKEYDLNRRPKRNN